MRVSGELEAAGTSVPLAFDASVSVIDGELELEATTTVDQGRFGMSEGPLEEHPADDEGAREGAPRPGREPLLIRRAGRGGSGRPPRGRGLAARPVSV